MPRKGQASWDPERNAKAQAKKLANKQAHALVQMETAIARAKALGVEMRAMPPTLTGSVKVATRAMVGPEEAWGIAHQLLVGAMDPSNPRQLDYISKLKEWIDGLETSKSENVSVQKRVVLNVDLEGDPRSGGFPVVDGSLVDSVGELGVVAADPPAATLVKRTELDVVPPEAGGTAAP